MDKPPAYSELSPLTTQTPNLSQHLSTVRTTRINNTLTSLVLPSFHAAASAGLSRTTLVLIPLENTALQVPSDSKDASPSTLPEVIGFPADDHMQVLPLESTEGNALEFWRQPSVSRELEGMLKARLAADGHRIREVPAATLPPSMPTPPPVVESKKSGGFFRRRGSGSQSQARTLSPSQTQAQMPWSFPVPFKEEPLSPGEVKVEVELRDVSFRVVSDMGLYDTKTGKAVVARIEIGT